MEEVFPTEVEGAAGLWEFLAEITAVLELLATGMIPEGIMKLLLI
jgi:hypothetical protein